jgi:hypothetical protein
MCSESPWKVIVLTGGPGGGKSELLERVLHDATLGPLVLALEEAIYAMRGCGLNPRSAEFQRLLVQRQKEREEDALRSEEDAPKRLLVMHRGTLDPCAFWQSFGNTRESFFEMTGTTLEYHYRRYDLVLHLESAAVRVPEAYRRWPLSHRPEEVAQAARLDELLGDLWSGHPHYVHIAGTLCFEDKMTAALTWIRRYMQR